MDQAVLSILKRALFDLIDTGGKGYINADDSGRVAKYHANIQVSPTDTHDFVKSRQASQKYTLSFSDFSGLFFSGLQHEHFPPEGM